MSRRRGSSWRVWVDTGGTFTDALGLDPWGRVHRAKILSTSALRGSIESREGHGRARVRAAWDAPAGFPRGFTFRLVRDDGLLRDAAERALVVREYDPETGLLVLSGDLPERAVPGSAFEVVSLEPAPLLAARLLARVPPGRPLPPMDMRLATTLGTNALLERSGVSTALFVTRGFGDLLDIGTQQRPDLFALEIRKSEPLYAAVVEVSERIAADGTVLRPLEEADLAGEARRLADDDIRAAAVALVNGYRNPVHESRVRDVLLDCGFRHVSVSSELAPFLKILPRAETAVVDAYLAPVVAGYLDAVAAGLRGSRLHVMTSAGGLVSAGAFRPKDSLSSGPAGGVIGAASAGRRSGHQKVIAFDMGGTSTDVARFDGDLEYVFEQELGDAHLVAPALAIESVAAGGGSVCWFDGSRFRVGPQSAGARPGPSCYGAGGPLTLTDVNLLLGRLDPDRFGIPVSADPAAAALERLLLDVEERTGERPAIGAALEGFLDIANERMADAIRRVSVRRGYDPSEYALVAFGGAGGQHACGVAERLGMRTVLVPADAGLLSAFGLGQAVVERFASRQVLRPLREVEANVSGWFDELAVEARRAVEAEGVPPSEIEVRRRLAHVRFVGQESSLEIDCGANLRLGESFEQRYTALFGHLPEGRPVEMESLRVIASQRAPGPASAGAPPHPVEACVSRVTGAWFGGSRRRAPVFERDALAPGARLSGPALVLERHTATVVDPGWNVEMDGAAALVVTRVGRKTTSRATRRRPAAVSLELFTNRFRAVAHEMGERLRRTAVSTNVKERLDFSCALFDPKGRLVVNAPHIPVHLGGLGFCVRSLRHSIHMQPGDVVVTNHPAHGGSHLPDVTVVTPVFPSAGRTPLGYVASRAHHAEIGGVRPGSMPPAATSLAEEGVVIPPTHLVRRGRADWSAVRRLLESSPFPSRAVEDNLADLRAAVAANHAGAEALRSLSETHGERTVVRYMRALEDLAEQQMREALARIPDGRLRAEERLDDDSPLRVEVTIDADEAKIDFTGSAGVHPGNLNATPAIVRSVVIYVLRLLLGGSLPMNEGLLRPVSLEVPPGILNPHFPDDPRLAPAVVGGNVETSQRLVDTLLKALYVAACSQGTMNNVIFGTERFGYYETVCGGCGAGPDFDGASAVHSHMTNTRATDPEVLEHRYPVRVERFAVRRGSGGAGRRRGGDGTVREITFLEPMSLSVLSQHRKVRPYGLEGGEPGASGAQRVVRATGEVVDLGPVDGCEVGPGDRFVLETPGGGGWGHSAFSSKD